MPLIPTNRFKDITGQRFGRLVVIERAENGDRRCAIWKCMCDCGNIHICAGIDLRSHKTRSCGCFRHESVVEHFTKHDKRHSRLYQTWLSMKQRCTNPNHKNYSRYGGRGITVCDKWINDFQAFYDWAMANGYDENAPQGKCTIDRIDNNKGYSPDNCRWVDMKTQSNNRSTNRKVKINGC